MAAPLTTARNKYHGNIKNSTIETPHGVSEFIFDKIEYYNKIDYVIDPASGNGNLLKPWWESGYKTIGVDIDEERNVDYESFSYDENALEWFTKINVSVPGNKHDLFILNPPFNTDHRNKQYLKDNKLGKALLPELFFKAIMDNYGHDTMLVMFAPMGFYFNQRTFSKRWKSLRDEYGDVYLTGFCPLPLNIFEGVEFHVGLWFYNLKLPSDGCCLFLEDEYLGD